MDKKLSDYYHTSYHDFLEALLNIGVFLPYFFSVKALLRTLFDPWKNLTAQRTERGFSFQDYFNQLGFNLVSRGMGFMMRSTVLFTYLIVMVLYTLFLPLIFAMYFIILPFLFLYSSNSQTEEEKKIALKNSFISSHMLNKDNYQEVEKWFEQLYAKYFNNTQWWKLSNLQSYPPLARDWAVGYTPTLDEFTEELTEPVYQSYMKHIVARGKEIAQVERILSKSDEANVILVGEEGTGRRTIVNALSKKIYEGKINSLLMYKRVLKVNMEKILTQYIEQKQREEFFSELLNEAALARNVIIVIENLDKYITHSENRVDLSTALTKFSKSSVQIIGLTTPFFYEKYIVPNEPISREFAKIDVVEVSNEEAFAILLDSAEEYEKRYQIIIPYETVRITVDKSDFYISSVPFPEKAMQLLDTACVYTTQTLKKRVVTPQIIDIVLTEKTHVPTSLTTEMKDKLLKLEMLLKKRVMSQQEAVTELASAFRRSFLLMGKRKKPIASFLFLGPTGVGKTETAKAIAEVFFESEKSLMRFDMSAYQTRMSIPQLVGSMELKSPGLLTKAIREQPYGVLLLDEIEKADTDLLNIFLTILDEGYFTDGLGKRVDCKNLVIIATSNAGADYIFKMLAEITNGAPVDQQAFTQKLIHHLVEEHTFTPEFLNRFDGVVAYNPLQETNIVFIAKKFLTPVTQQIESMYKIKVKVSDETLENLAKKSYDPAFGARDMERILRQDIEDKIAKMIFEGKAKEGDTINL